MENQEKKYPKITIVATCFNREKYIADTIESVLNQKYPNLEFIVVDDDSSDHSLEVINRYKDKLAFVGKLPGKRTNAVPVINYALSKSTGEIMTTLNDKNLLLPGSLWAAAEIFTAYPDVEWFTGIGSIANKDGIITSIVPIRKSYYEHFFRTPYNIQHESTFWRRSLWERTGGKFDEASPWAFDYELWCRFFAVGAKLFYVDTIIGAYRKLATAHGSTKPNEYHHYASLAREKLRAQAPRKDLVYAAIFKWLRYAKPLLRNIPDKAYEKIPFLNIYCNEAISFKGSKSGPLVRYKRNPFRTIYPW